LFTAAYNRSQIVDDLLKVSDAERIDLLVTQLRIVDNPDWAKGRLYELQSAARKLDEALNASADAKLTVVSKYTKEIDPSTGKRLDWTDIDFIIDDGLGNTVYYQAKSTAGAFGSANAAKEDALRWIRLAQNDAVRSGITNQVIKYMVPPDVTVPQSVQELFADLLQNEGLVIDVVNSPLLR
jgi:hypothetical protein